MRNQTKYLFIYLCVLCFLVGSVLNLAQAEETPASDQAEQEYQLSQAKLDQLLAPIALYPDTLLSHIFVASTYPLEVIQAARWRKNNQDLDEQEALNAVEDKDWDPSVKALVPFHDLLQKLNADLAWLQSLGSAFLFDQERVLDAVQLLRQKAYAQGNLENNEYLQVEEDEGEIVIQNVEKHVIYVPQYDTRVVYGDWWWHDHPPYYWHSPSHYVWNAGFYWGPRIHIRPSFYFAGLHWRNRHLVADHSYRITLGRHWSQTHTNHRRVRVTEYPKWSHNQHHRRGVHYKQNGHRIIRNSENPHRFVSVNNQGRSKKQYQIDKQRVLNTNHYPKSTISNSQQVKQKLARFDKQKHINRLPSQQRVTTTQHVKSKHIKRENQPTRQQNSPTKSRVSDKQKRFDRFQSTPKNSSNQFAKSKNNIHQSRPSTKQHNWQKKSPIKRPSIAQNRVKSPSTGRQSNLTARNSSSASRYSHKPQRSMAGNNKSRTVHIERHSRSKDRR